MGKHIGVWNPEGDMIKEPVPGRRIDPLIQNDEPFFTPNMIKTMIGIGVTGGLLF
jgi:hypothetical protein